MCSPSNPTGSVYTKNELAALAAVIEKHQNVYIIADEIYEHINYIGEHESIAQFTKIFDRVVIVNGVSKGYAMTGWRIGWIAAPQWIASACTMLRACFWSFFNFTKSSACGICWRPVVSEIELHLKDVVVLLLTC